jgi:hypothetical protein
MMTIAHAGHVVATLKGHVGCPSQEQQQKQDFSSQLYPTGQQ